MPRSLARAWIFALMLACLGAACQQPAQPKPLTAEDVLAHATEAARTLDSLHVVLTIQGVAAPIATGLGLTRAEGDLRRPADAHLKLTLMFGTSTLESELRAIDGRTFVRNPLGSRFEELRGAARIALLDPEAGLVAVIPRITDAALAAREMDGNVTLHRVDGRIPSEAVSQLIGGSPTGSPVSLQAWVRETDWFPRRLTLSGASLVGDQPEVIRTIEITGWNQPVTIPTPTTG